MSFVPNNANQMTLFDSYLQLTDREKRFLDHSWAKPFAEIIFPAIDEAPFAVLYSSKDSRPNTPVNVMVGASILQQLTGQSDDEIIESLMFDVRYQYALHTTSYREQPLSDRTLGRFRARCNAHLEETGTDLLHDAVMSLTEQMAKLMKIDHHLKRMDSMMIASNIKRMSRLELLYTCVANLVKKMAALKIEIPEEMQHYTAPNDRNVVIYHNHNDETAAKIETILKDAAKLLPLCEGKMDETSEYLLFVRALNEQTVTNEDGSYRLRTKEDGGMNSGILQNPADPEATYREKAGTENIGYSANVVEETNANGDSLVTEYQMEQNTYSDSQFAKDYVGSLPDANPEEESTRIVADGAYTCNDQELLEKKNTEIINTNLTGREAPDINADFEFNDDGTRITKCPGGYTPKSCSYSRQNGQCVASFERSQCEACPYKDKCNPKMNKRTCRKQLSVTSKRRAIQQRRRSSQEFKEISAYRNGIETIPSVLRRKYHVDRMPVRGKTRCKFFLGCKIAALNFKKFCKYLQSGDTCAQNAAIG